MTNDQTVPSPSSDDLDDDLDTASTADPLEDLYQDAMLQQAARNPKLRKAADPSIRHSIDAATKRMRELYTLPENWVRGRGIALIDKGTQALVGNFSEYIHISLPGTRKLIREHGPLAIDATEIVEGYLGEAFEQRVRGRSWAEKHAITADLWLDELAVGAPQVRIYACMYLGSVTRVELESDTQLASVAGNVVLKLPSGTDIYGCLSTDTKNWIRKQVTI